MIEPSDRSYRGKRAVDLMLLALVAGPATVVGTLCAAIVKATSPGPVFFRQERVGLAGRPFHVCKFRTMEDALDNPIFPAAHRITPVGRWLRRFSLDELPQLINVARGEMSFVGPRPALAYQVQRYDSRQAQRLTVRPGITGLAQVRGRNAIAWDHRIERDLEYLETQSPLFDLRVLWWSVKTVIAGSGVEGHPIDDPLAQPPDVPG